MESHEVGGSDLGEIERLCCAVAAEAARSGGIGITSGQVIATLRSLRILMSLVPTNFQPTADWDNPDDRGRSVYELVPIIQNEIPGPVSPSTVERIMSRLDSARVQTIGQLITLSRWDLEEGRVRVGQVSVKLLEAALALRNLRLIPNPVPR